MTTVRFSYADPQRDGVDAPTAGLLLLSLALPGEVDGTFRTTRPFPVKLDGAGDAVVELSPGTWRLLVSGVAGERERWFQVPDSLDVLDAVDMVNVDPVVLGPLPQAFVWDLTGGAEFPAEAVDGDVGIDSANGDMWRFVA